MINYDGHMNTMCFFATLPACFVLVSRALTNSQKSLLAELGMRANFKSKQNRDLRAPVCCKLITS